MKKAAKRLLILAMVAACLLVCIPQANADPLPELPADLYLTQNVAGTCTLCSAAMMIRASLYQHNNSNWATVTENGLRKDAWMEGVGLKWSFSHKIGNTTVKVGHKNVSGMTVQALKELLDEHPEGIVLYCGKLPHAVYLTGYVGDEFYCADTVKGISETMHLSKGMISQAVESLRKKKMVTVNQSKQDRRSVLIHLSQIAHPVLDKLKESSANFVDRIVSGVSFEQLQALSNTVSQISKNKADMKKADVKDED